MLLLTRIRAIPTAETAMSRAPASTTAVLRPVAKRPTPESHREMTPPGSFLRFTRSMRSSFIRAIKAGTSVKLIRRTTRVPKATSRPKIFTGTIGPTASEAKPAAVVRSE